MQTKYYMDACTDCVAFAANGTPGDYEGAPTPEMQATAIREHTGETSLAGLVNAEEIDPETGNSHEDWFTWSACECCGSHLGGMRNRLAMLGA